MKTLLTAAPGKRTKHQQSDHNQLFLFAQSSLVLTEPLQPEASNATDSSAGAGAGATTTTDPSGGASDPSASASDPSASSADSSATAPTSGWQHGEWELGRRLVSEVAGGNEAAIREVLLLLLLPVVVANELGEDDCGRSVL